MLSESDKALRRGRVGASDAPALLGYSPWKKPEQAIEDWVLSQSEPLPTFAPQDRGNRYEDAIVDAYVERTLMREVSGRVQVQKCPTQVHPKLDWLVATFDRLVLVEGRPERLVQAKHTDSAGSRAKWKASHPLAPEYVVCQVVVELALAHELYGIEHEDIVADLGGNSWLGTSVFPCKRNEAVEADILGRLLNVYATQLRPRLPKEEMAHA